MIWDWNNPIGLGLFFLMCTGAALLLGGTVWLLARAGVPYISQRNRR